MARTPDEITRAKDILSSINPTRLDVHPCAEKSAPVELPFAAKG
jgi:hypothetical protein